jgi:hypothetical protein
MPERTGGDHSQVVHGDVFGAVEGGECSGTTEEREFAADAIGADSGAELRRLSENRVGDLEAIDALAGALHFPAFGGIGVGPLVGEAVGVPIKGIAALDDFHACVEVGGGRDFDREAEAVKQLRAEVAFLGVTAPDEDKACGVPHADPFALDDVLAGGGNVEEEIDEVVLEEIDLVYIEVAAMGAGEEPGFVGLLAAGEGALEVEGADDAILGCTEREIDDGDADFVGAELLAGLFAGEAVVASAGAGVGVAAVPAAADDVHQWKERREGADRRGFGGPSMAEDKDPTDGGVNGGEEDGTLHFLLTDDRREWEGDAHGSTPGGKCQPEITLWSRVSQSPDGFFVGFS